MKRKRKWQRRISRATRTVFGIATLLGAQSAGAEVCDLTQAMVEQALPGNLEAHVDQLLQSPRGVPQLVDRFQTKAPVLSLALGERFKPDSDNCAARDRGRDIGQVDCHWVSKKGDGRLEVDLNEGRLRYHNPERFDPAGKRHEVDENSAKETVRTALQHLGFSPQELGQLEASEVFAYRYPPDPVHPPRRVALGVRARRQWNGFPVEGSSVNAAINADGAIESLSVRWPDFQLAPGLSRDFGLSRAELAYRISVVLDRDYNCGEIGSLYIEPVFTPETMLPTGSTPADPLLQGPPTAGARTRAPFFVPALRVVAIPAERGEQADDTGATTPPVRIRSFPLLDTAGF